MNHRSPHVGAAVPGAAARAADCGGAPPAMTRRSVAAGRPPPRPRNVLNYFTVLGGPSAEGVCVWSGGVARWDDIPIRAVYNASQDDGYLELVVVPMMLRAGCGVSVCVACVRG